MGKHINRKPLGDHEVGYGRTPVETRFPHQQRKPRKSKATQRDLGVRQIMRELFTALEEQVTIVRDGKRVRTTASDAIFRHLVAKAVKGDNGAMRRIIDLQVMFMREYEEGRRFLSQALADMERYEREVQPLNAKARRIKREMEERLSNPRELWREGGDDE